MSHSVSPVTTRYSFSVAQDEGVGAAVGAGRGTAVGVGATRGEAVSAAAVGAGVAVGTVVVIGIGLRAAGGDPDGDEAAGVSFAHAARRAPRRRDAAPHLAFICRRRWCCELSRR
jgi:hypothetical protein